MTGLIPLARLFTARRFKTSAVAWTADGKMSWENFTTHVGGLCQQLQSHPNGEWLLACESSYAFAVGLMALAQTGRLAVLPPNQQPESLRTASAGVRGVLSDKNDEALGKSVISPLAFKGSWRWKSLDRKRAWIVLRTSGSTGEPKAITKTIGQLEAEIAVLEKTFGRRLGRCEIVSSVSHQHIYGLLFRLLWPLCAGRAFPDKPFLWWEDLTPRLHDRHTPWALISSPAHLERIPEGTLAALRRATIRAIFSSGGPLSAAAAQRVREVIDRAPIEVLGSTETGGVGWRQQRAHAETPWTVLDRVQLRIDQKETLRVLSPFAGAAWTPLGDRGVIVSKNKFLLRGRADRIVKLAEKRVSLDAYERQLRTHPWVQDAKAIVIQAGRPSVGVVITLTAAGEQQSKREDVPSLVVGLRKHLGGQFEAVTLPRAFRFVERFPFDSQGKVTLVALTALFEDASPTEPHTLDAREDDERWTLYLKVPPQLVYLDGHFPGHPIVPGIVQIQWVVRAATQWLGRPLKIRQMEAIKFKNLLRPGHTFSLSVEKANAAQAIRFTLLEGETLYSSGRLVLR